jgi:hypothetical protein
VREIGAIMSSGPRSPEGRILLDFAFEANRATLAPQGLSEITDICVAVRSAGVQRIELIGLSAGSSAALTHARAEALRDAMVSRCVSESVWAGDCPGLGCHAITVERESPEDALPVTGSGSGDETLIEIRVLG